MKRVTAAAPTDHLRTAAVKEAWLARGPIRDSESVIDGHDPGPGLRLGPIFDDFEQF